MADERVVSDIVTKFLLNTCRLRPQVTKHAVLAATTCSEIALLNPITDAEVNFIPLTTGSVAEFYIEPMLPLVGDVDVMWYSSIELVIPRGHPPPTQLPAEFHNYVKVFEIVDSHLPGYVYLELRYLLTEFSEDHKYGCIEYDSRVYGMHNVVGLLSHNDGDLGETHGPAVLHHTALLSIDSVCCVRCLSWPSQAADWPTRHRNYDWPDSATVDRVVNNGCDVVGVAHRQCRQDQWMGKAQWRLSFSRAEIVLTNSWMPVQQVVYYMLRVFMKTELFANNNDNSEACVLSNYHVKTLMMWACEMKPNSFWTDDLNLVRICVELLHTLSVWLTDARCQHYFINNCNLIDNSSGMVITARQVMSVDEAWLSTWFVNNHIRKCSMLCPENVSSLFSDVNTNMKLHKLQKAVSAVVNYRRNTLLRDTWNVFRLAEFGIASTVYTGSAVYQVSVMTVQSCICWLTELEKIDKRLSIYFATVLFLHAACKISKAQFVDGLADVLAIIIGDIINTRRHPSQSRSELSLSKATQLMKVVANSSRSTRQLIEIELSKAYLYRALRCKDSDSDSIYCLANVYLAVLYYTTGQYQSAIDLCTLVTRSQDHSQCSSHVVQGELLPKIDDDIDTVLGLAMFYQYVRTAALNQRQTQHVSVFTTELFARCLNIICLSVTQTMSNDDVCRFGNYFSNTQLMIADVLAVKSYTHNFHCQSITVHSSQQSALSATDLNTSELAELLQRSAVEHLKTFRQLKARDFGSVATIVATDFEALYAYKHGDYQQCLQLSTQNVRTLLYGVSNHGALSEVPTFPEFIQLLDDDIVSLTALTLIVNPKHRNHSAYVCITQLTLSLYLMTQCQLKLRHSVTSLAHTLDYIKVAQISHPHDRWLDQLTLKLTGHKLLTYLLSNYDT